MWKNEDEEKHFQLLCLSLLRQAWGIRMKKIGKKIGIPAALLAAAVFVAFGQWFAGTSEKKEPVFYPMRTFSNMCAYEGTVYRGVNGAYGNPIVQESSIFTIWEDKVYYVDKVQEAYESITDERQSILRANRDGSNEEVIVDDVFLAGMGYEKLIGDKLFYGCEYDDDYRMSYAYVDIYTGAKGRLKSGRIDHILGYDGDSLYYSGYDKEMEQNILGRIDLKNGRDKTLAVYAPIDEEGYIESVYYYEGEFYCLTLVEKPEGYDYRTYVYRIQIRNGINGEVEREISLPFTGSANYSLLIEGGAIVASVNGEIIRICTNGSMGKEVIAVMKEGEYWGILHFLPGDGYLYYEAIAETDEDTQYNDYFYRVPKDGGEAELLSAWFTI